MSNQSATFNAQNRVGYRVKETHAALRAAMDRALLPIGITVPQYSCLTMLAEGGRRSKAELARAVFVTRQTMTVMLDGMEDRGHVSRADVPANSRSVPYGVTDEGLQLLRAAEKAVSGVEQAMISDLSDEETETLRQLLARCTQSVRAYEGPSPE